MAEKRFEKAMERLEAIVKDLESGELGLEESLKLFEEGIRLVRFCEEKLNEAERKVTLLTQREDGSIQEEPFEVEEQGE
jgi:exodeoxyribonuclease VII small subunit